MKRLVQALLVACWLAAVAIYWHDCVPAVPTTVIEFDRPAVIIGTTRRKELVTAAPSEGDRGNRQTTGPVQFWNLAEGTVPRVFDLEEGMTAPQLLGDDLLKATSGGRTRLYDLESMDLVDELPVGARGAFCASRDHQLVGYLRDGQLVVRDCRERKDLWSRPGVLSAHAGDHTWLVTYEGADRKAPVLTLVDMLTGERISRFDHLGPILMAQATPAADYALFKLKDGRSVMCRQTTGEQLWETSQRTILGFFSDDGSELLRFESDGTGTGSLARRRSLDGAIIAAPVRRPSSGGDRWSASNRRYTFMSGEFSSLPITIEAAIRWVQAKTGANFLDVPTRHLFRLIDTQRCSVVADLGEPVSSQNPAPRFLQGFGGFLVERNGQIEYYTIPPRRKWSWLASWGLLPPTILIFCSRGSRFLWKRRSAQSPPLG